MLVLALPLLLVFPIQIHLINLPTWFYVELLGVLLRYLRLVVELLT